VSLTIYVEGGGNTRATLSECRQGFSEFFAKVLKDKPRPKIVACGARNDAFTDFRIALGVGRADSLILLVDSEAPIEPTASAWRHVKSHDKWTKPKGATEDNVHLMVQSMEAWFLADRDALARFYGQGFNANALPRQPDVEQVPKAKVLAALKEATRKTKTKGPYGKSDHGFELLRHIDPDKVCEGSKRAKRLIAVLKASKR